jgi:3'-phosphoadenosine 5'-phosphosulfate sulfotransferase (PAPS reductase)/FAD synthetase
MCVAELALEVDKSMPMVFFDTGVEFPEIIARGKEFGDRVTWFKPKHSFVWAIKNKGFPLISKNQSEYIDRFRQAQKARWRAIVIFLLTYRRINIDASMMILTFIMQKTTQVRGRLFGYEDKDNNKLSTGKISNKYHYYAMHGTRRVSNECCNVLKKNPAKRYYKETGNLAFIGTKAADSDGRKRFFMKTNCFNEDASPPQAYPIHFWTENDVNRFIKERKIRLAAVYDMKFDGSGCVGCGFGIAQEKKNACDKMNRFERMKTTHPRQYGIIMDKWGMRGALKELNGMIGYTPDYTMLGFEQNSFQMRLDLKDTMEEVA